MMIHVPQVLNPEQVARCREVMEKADWVDGKVTAGEQSARVKFNLQLPETSPEARELGEMVMQALGRSDLFFAAVLPKQVFPPLFNRYDAGMTFGAHVDNAVRTYLNSPLQVRTDVSTTLFISSPEDYDGGELVVEDTYGTHKVKLPAGDMIVYPGTSPAQCHADHARLAHRVVLLDPEPDPRRRPPRAAVRSRHVDPAARDRCPGAQERGGADQRVSQPAAAMGGGVIGRRTAQGAVCPQAV